MAPRILIPIAFIYDLEDKYTAPESNFSCPLEGCHKYEFRAPGSHFLVPLFQSGKEFDGVREASRDCINGTRRRHLQDILGNCLHLFE